MKKELNELYEYLTSKKSEKANDHLVFPLFKSIYGKKVFRKESDADGADIYIEGRLVVELKTKYDDWLPALFQGMHYQKKSLSFSSVCVITHQFIGLWRLNELPDFALSLYNSADPLKPANEIGIINSKKINIAQKNELLKKSFFTITSDYIENTLPGQIDLFLSEFVDRLQNLDSIRQQINPHNFIQKIELLKEFFDNPLEAIHCFYSIVAFWDTTSTVPIPPPSDISYLWVNGKNGQYASEKIFINPRHHEKFRNFIQSHYIFTNHEAGLDIDYYFSRFDEVMSKLDPEYTRQHGIFFTDINLSKFALWYIHYYYEKKLSDKYIVLDPAGGSGNLVTSWRRNHLKYKIVSELQPDLLKTIERRMLADSMQIQAGFTIVPKTTENRGLNFINQSAKSYIEEINHVLKEKNLKIDKPIAFLLNPPYKNTDENEGIRIEKDAQYTIDPSIIEFTGEDAAKERYLAFLAQIINISKLQVESNSDFKPLLMIFTPTSWLIPRPTYIHFRNKFDNYFKYETGFITTSNEFFKLGGRFPISFTIWSYNYNKNGNKNIIKVKDLTHLTQKDLLFNWNVTYEELDKKIIKLIKGSSIVNFSSNRIGIKEWTEQLMYDFKRDATKEELKQNIYGGLPLKDERRNNKKTYGILNSEYVGFMDNSSPVRIKHKDDGRFSKNHEEIVWFRLDNDFKSINKTRILNGPPDKYGYAAYNLESAKKTFCWFAITKALNGVYPVWVNQFDIWKPEIPKNIEKYFYSLCFAFGLSENRCVVTKFEKDNPIKGAPEIFIDNPLCPLNPNSFFSTVLDKEIVKKPSTAIELVSLIKELYNFWNLNYTKGNHLLNVGLANEPYFKYFDYPDFVTPYSGLIQIKKFAEVNNSSDLIILLKNISDKTKEVREMIYSLLTNEVQYFK